MEIAINISPTNPEQYERFLAIKRLPRYRFVGRTAYIPEEYLSLIGLDIQAKKDAEYVPHPMAFDYQRDITRIAVRKKKFALFVAPGLGKTLMQTDFARHSLKCLPHDKCTLMIAPPMVVPQTMSEIERFYGHGLPVEHVSAKNLSSWLTSGTSRLGITNYEALKDETPNGRLGALICDESSNFKSFGGKWASICIRLGKGLEWKMSATGTPAPNDRIEFANQAVFLDQYPNVNSFLSRFFYNRGETNNRWELKPHAVKPFYLSLSHWCIFLNNPETYGWKDNAGTIPPIHVHIDDVPLSDDQRSAAMGMTGAFSFDKIGGIASRSKMGQLAKGRFNGNEIETNKPAFIRKMVDSWPEESTIIWCVYNAEQDLMEKTFPEAASIRGETPFEKRIELIADFKSGKRKQLIGKSETLGFGLNLQVCTRMVFSGIHDSYEEFYQCVKRANRVGSTRPLNVHVPLTELERPMFRTVLDKKDRIEKDTLEQERIFREASLEIRNGVSECLTIN